MGADSNVYVYWKPEHPPPSTAMRNFKSGSLFIKAFNRLDAALVMINPSSRSKTDEDAAAAGPFPLIHRAPVNLKSVLAYAVLGRKLFPKEFFMTLENIILFITIFVVDLMMLVFDFDPLNLSVFVIRCQCCTNSPPTS